MIICLILAGRFLTLSFKLLVLGFLFCPSANILRFVLVSSYSYLFPHCLCTACIVSLQIYLPASDFFCSPLLYFPCFCQKMYFTIFLIENSQISINIPASQIGLQMTLVYNSYRKDFAYSAIIAQGRLFFCFCFFAFNSFRTIILAGRLVTFFIFLTESSFHITLKNVKSNFQLSPT